MDGLEAATKIIDSLAWPTIIGLTFLVFPKKVEGIIDRIKSLTAGSVKVELYENVKNAALEVVKQREKVIAAQPLGEDERHDAAAVLDAALSELAAAIENKQDIAQNLEWTKLTPGREKILRMVVTSMGPAMAASLPAHHIQSIWRELATSAGLNSGAMTGLRSVGIVDARDRLTHTGAELIRSLGREVMLSQNL